MTVQCCPLFPLAVSDLSAASLLLLLWGVCGLRPLVFWVAAHCSYSSFPFSLFSLFLSAFLSAFLSVFLFFFPYRCRLKTDWVFPLVICPLILIFSCIVSLFTLLPARQLWLRHIT